VASIRTVLRENRRSQRLNKSSRVELRSSMTSALYLLHGPKWSTFGMPSVQRRIKWQKNYLNEALQHPTTTGQLLSISLAASHIRELSYYIQNINIKLVEFWKTNCITQHHLFHCPKINTYISQFTPAMTTGILLRLRSLSVSSRHLLLTDLWISEIAHKLHETYNSFECWRAYSCKLGAYGGYIDSTYKWYLSQLF